MVVIKRSKDLMRVTEYMEAYLEGRKEYEAREELL